MKLECFLFKERQQAAKKSTFCAAVQPEFSPSIFLSFCSICRSNVTYSIRLCVWAEVKLRRHGNALAVKRDENLPAVVVRRRRQCTSLEWASGGGATHRVWVPFVNRGGRKKKEKAQRDGLVCETSLLRMPRLLLAAAERTKPIGPASQFRVFACRLSLSSSRGARS